MDHQRVKSAFSLFFAATLLIFLTGCGTVYYSAMEKIGKEKRHILVDNVADVQDSQTMAQEEFTDALEKLKALYHFDGAELEKFYHQLKDSYDDCESRAGQIEKRIQSVQQVAKDLFAEWDAEIQQMSDPKLKSGSKASLQDAKVKYRNLENVMAQSTRSMYPVLTRLKDYVLYLKHNLNAKAVGSLSGEVVSIEKDVAKLITDMNTSIAEAEQFIKNF